jgi:hypothetical protein
MTLFIKEYSKNLDEIKLFSLSHIMKFVSQIQLLFNLSVRKGIISWVSSVSIVIMLQAGRSRNWSSLCQNGQEIFLLSTLSRPALGPTQLPMWWVLGTLFPGIKYLRHEIDHSPPSCAEVENAWNYTSTPSYVSMAWWLIKDRDNSTLLFS